MGGVGTFLMTKGNGKSWSHCTYGCKEDLKCKKILPSINSKSTIMHLLGTFALYPSMCLSCMKLLELIVYKMSSMTYMSNKHSLPVVIFETSAVSSLLVLGILAFTTAENAEGGKIKYMECLYIVNSMEIERM